MRKIAVITTFVELFEAFSLCGAVESQLKSLLKHGYDVTFAACEGFRARGVFADPRLAQARLPNFQLESDSFAVEYPAPGAPDVAEEVADVVEPVWVGLDVDSWGIDHGTWSVLCHAFPDADVPVVQLAINAMKPPEYHLDLGARLAPLRERGVLIVGSGNVVHNLRGIDPRLRDDGFDWARRFDEAATEVLAGDPAAAAGLSAHPDYGTAAPTPDHFLPLLYVAGVAAAAGRGADVLVEGYAYGSLSMTAYTVGAGPVAATGDGDGAAPLPDPSAVPTDDTNL